MKTKIYKKSCAVCGLIIKSKYKTQFDYNWKQHTNSHKRQNEKRVALKGGKRKNDN